MRFRGKAITGTSILMMLGALCFATVLVAAAIITSFTTSPKEPATVNLVKGSDEWSAAGSYSVGTSYVIQSSVYYSGTPTWYLTVDPAVATGSLAADGSDFTLSYSTNGVDYTSLTWKAASTLYYSIAIDTQPANIYVKIVPNSGSLDLTGVSWTIAADNANPAL